MFKFFGFTIFVFTLAILEVSSIGEQDKPYRLKVLHLAFLPEDLHSAIAEIILDAVSNRTDLLPDYNIEFQYADGDTDNQAPKEVIQFRYEPISDDMFHAPIVVGPEFSTNCKALGPILPYIDMVDISLTCTAPIFANHALYPNLYLAQQTQQFTTLAILRFIRDIGKWNRFAIVTSINNVNDYTSAILINKIAIDNGFVVTLFNMVPDVNEELVTPIKNSDTRVVVVYSSDDTFTFPFLCLAYKMGITGPRYVFIGNTGAVYYDPVLMTDDSYHGCTQQIIRKQLQQTYWIDPAVNFDSETRSSELGHTQQQFTQLLQEKLANSTGRNADDHYRFLLYDCCLKAIFALQKAEEQLKNRWNLTLRNYTEYPDVIMEAVNDSLKTINIAGLHIDRLSYSKAGLPENEGPTVVQWSLENGLQNVALGYQNGTDDEFSLQHYSLRTIRTIKWLPRDGLPPRDGRKAFILERKVPIWVIATVICLVAIVTLLQLAATTATTVAKSFRSEIKISQIITYSGCILLNISSILFVCENQLLGATFFLVIGLTVSNSILASRGSILRRVVAVSKDANATLGTMRPVVTAASPSVRMPTSAASGRSGAYQPTIPILLRATVNWKRFEKLTLICSAFIVLIEAIILLCWVTTNPLTCKREFVGDGVYDEENDVFIETVMDVCMSENMTMWSLGLTFLQAVLLLISTWLGYLAKKAGYFPPRFTFVQLGLGNSAILLLGILLVVIVLRDPVNQRIAIAFGGLFNSAITSAAIFAFSIHRQTVDSMN